MPDGKPSKWSVYNMGMVGAHLTLNPQKPLPVEARIARQFLDRGLTLQSEDLQTLLDDREAGIEQLNNILDPVLPGFTQEKRRKFATQLADKLLDKSLSAQLSREAPTTLDALQFRDDQLQSVFRQSLQPGDKRAEPPTLLEQIPVGVSVTVYF